MKHLLWMSMLALMVLGCNTKSSSSEKGTETDEARELKTEVYEYNEDTRHYEASVSIEFPVGGDEELGDSVFAFIARNIKEQQAYEGGLDKYRNNGEELVEFFGKKISNDLKEGWMNYTDGDESTDDVLNEDIKFSLLEDNDNYLTYLYDYDCYYGDDDYMNKVGVTFLKDDCNRVTNEFLFKDPSSQKLLDLVVETLIENYCRGENAFLEESELENIEELPAAPFYITKEGVAFIYRMYEVHWSLLEGVIPWNKVKKLLTDEAQALRQQ